MSAATPTNGKKEWMTPSGILVAVSLMAGLWGLVVKPMMDENSRIDARVAVMQTEHGKQIEILRERIVSLEGSQARISAAVTADSEMKFQRVDEVYSLLQMIYPKVTGLTLPPHTAYLNTNPSGGAGRGE